MYEKLTDFRQLDVWQKAHSLVLNAYEITKKFPKDERQDLVYRLRDYASQVPIQIAQGFMRRNPKEKSVAYKGTLTSLEAFKYCLILSQDLGYVKDITDIFENSQEVGRMLTGLVKSARSNIRKDY